MLVGHEQVKNVSRDNLEGKVGRMYVPRQEVDTMPLRKMKVSWSLSRRHAAHRLSTSCKTLVFECCTCSAWLGGLTGSLAC